MSINSVTLYGRVGKDAEEDSICPLCYREYQLLITDDSVYYVSLEHNDWLLGYGQSLWDSMLISIGWLIKEGYFNKEYLV